MTEENLDEAIHRINNLEIDEMISLSEIATSIEFTRGNKISHKELLHSLKEHFGNTLKVVKKENKEYIMKDEIEESLSIKGKPEIYNNAIIKVEREYFSIYELKRKYDRSKKGLPSTIILDSDFQRNEVWKRNQQSELIESVLMGLPLPTIYLFENKIGDLLVVDGRQRLTAFFSFMDDKFPLKNLSIMTHINGKKFSQLEAKQISKLEDFQLITQVIKPPTPDRIKFDIFDRVNRGGTALNNQEMRNALYQGKSTKLLKDLSSMNVFKESTDRALSFKRMRDSYVILRFLAMYLLNEDSLRDDLGNLYEYKGDMDDLLGKTMEFINNESNENINLLNSIFSKAMKNSLRYIGPGAYRLPHKEGQNKRPLNMALFETIAYWMAKIPEELDNSEAVKLSYNSLMNNEEYIRAIKAARDTSNNVSQRFKIIKKIMGELND